MKAAYSFLLACFGMSLRHVRVFADVIINTDTGDVRGLETSVLGRDVDVYWGIPYATIPARFQRPVRIEPWEGVLNATTPPPSCPEVPYQGDIPLIPPTSTPFAEDCLFLNVWVPRGCSTGTGVGLAVMVWIHGGGLEWGSSTVPTYNGQVLAATRCVIVATLNYRLGPLGFLSLGNQLAPGNAGLLDQSLALRWIHDNIPHFGGSRDRITLFGESAGGFSVGAHMASPLSRDLFSRAIMQSGSPTQVWGAQTVSDNSRNARELARLLDCPDEEDDAMIACLSRADFTEVGRAVRRLAGLSTIAFGLVVDGHFIHEPLFDLYRKGDVVKNVSVLLGVTKDDGSFILPTLIPGITDTGGRPHLTRTAFQQFISLWVQPVMASFIEYVYVDSWLPAERDDYLRAAVRVVTDQNMACPVYTTAAAFQGRSPVFLYSFNHRSSLTSFPEWMGAVHASELDFVFGRPLDTPGSFSEQERQLSRVMMSAWANFAKDGIPSVDTANETDIWPALDNTTFPYAVFDVNDYVTIKHGLRHRECAFWNDVYTASVSESETSGAMSRLDTGSAALVTSFVVTMATLRSLC